MRCLLIDDEPLARRELARLLAPHPDVEIAGEADGVDEALALTARLRPDVVFLDVRLRGENGFDYVGRLPAGAPAPRIVFVTAHDRYAVRGFECDALDYLLKPAHPGRLALTLERIRRREAPPPPSEATGPDDRTLLRIGTATRFALWRDILRVEAEGNYTRVHVRGEPPALVLRTLAEWARLAPRGFFLQPHRALLVSRACVREARPAARPDRHELVLADGAVIDVSRARWPAVRDALGLM